MIRRLVLGALLLTAVAAVAAVPAAAHQIASHNGVVVQTHVNPNDEPVAGEPTTVWVVRVKALKAKFAWATCRCRLKVFDSSGAVVLDTAAKRPLTAVTFPEAKAYGITFTGRVRKTGIKRVVWKRFKVTYAIRASARE